MATKTIDDAGLQCLALIDAILAAKDISLDKKASLISRLTDSATRVGHVELRANRLDSTMQTRSQNSVRNVPRVLSMPILK